MDAARTDLLSQLLTLIRLRGELIYSAQVAAPWSLSFPPGAAHFHFVEEGEAHIIEGSGQSLLARAGDLVVLPLGQGHMLLDRLGSPALPIDPIEMEQFDVATLSLQRAGPGETTKMVSGTFHFDGHSSPMILKTLPSIIKISRTDGSNAEWLEALVRFMLAEAHLPRPGSAIMISRLIDVLIVQTLRSWASGNTPGNGWAGGIGEPGIERALSALHAEPMLDWSVAKLAAIAIMSRSAFAERFTVRVGEPPLRYLKHWRLALADDMLNAGVLKVMEVARRVGYDSDAAFSRAYKSRYGKPPVSALRERREA